MMKKQRILRIGEVLLFAMILSIPSAALASSLNSSSIVVSINITNNTSNLPNSGYQIMFWRYPEGGGAPTLAASAISSAGKTIQLSDSGLSQLHKNSQYVHYSALVMLSLPNGSLIQLCNYHWTSQIVGIHNTEDIAIILTTGGIQLSANGQSVPYQATAASPSSPTGNVTSGIGFSTKTAAAEISSQPTWPITVLQATGRASSGQQSSQVTPDSPSSCYWNWIWYYCWVQVATWQSVPTTIGEATGSGYMGDTFAYGQSSGSTLSVDASANGGAWSVSGSYTWFNQNSGTVTWPTLQCCWNWLIQSHFNYEEDQLEYCPLMLCGVMQSSYQIWASGWQGGAEPWTPQGGHAGPSSSQPGDCLAASALPNHYSYAPYAAYSGFTFDAANGYKYSLSASLSVGIVGTTFSAGITDTTDYSQHTTQTITFGNHYSTYYLYTNGLYSNVLNWPVLFSTNSAAHCGP
jgi:hypothetical protein